MSLLILGGVMLNSAPAQEAGDLVRLRKAGVGDEVLALIVKEKVIPTQALTVEEIIQLKQGGMDDETLGKLIRNASFMTRNEKRVYGGITRSLESLTVDDLIRLKEAGLSDELIRAVVIYRSPESRAADKAQAWDMLKNMDLKLLLK
ncbi:MAG: hypothetical protein WBG37_19025 [Desulfobacterales bacterium]